MEREPIDWMPREYRRRVSVEGSAVNAEDKVFRLVVTNMSYGGCQIMTEECLSPGETLRMHLPRMGEIAGQVRWAAGEKCGVRFLVGISAKDDRRARIGV